MRAIPVFRTCLAGTTLALLAACSTPQHRAPVEDRGAARSAGGPSAPVNPADATKPLPGIENAGKPGFYTVKPGDTMIRICLESGQNWRDIARWNAIDNPNSLEVGQVLRVVPPGVDPNAPATRGVTASRVEPRPLDAKPSSVPASGATTAAAPVVASAPAASAAPPAVAREPDDDIAWGWPSSSAVVTPFDDTRTKGVVFTGKAGDPVLAAADGRVVYAGSGLRGYGNLVIVKHNSTYLSAYAHNQTLLVKEDQVVRRGQKIAEMGSSDAERVQLHFEIRRLGKPVDPARLLPPR
jgi:lipoprotein NlpD